MSCRFIGKRNMTTIIINMIKSFWSNNSNKEIRSSRRLFFIFENYEGK